MSINIDLIDLDLNNELKQLFLIFAQSQIYLFQLFEKHSNFDAKDKSHSH